LTVIPAFNNLGGLMVPTLCVELFWAAPRSIGDAGASRCRFFAEGENDTSDQCNCNQSMYREL
jgi:hypothetical protein